MTAPLSSALAASNRILGRPAPPADPLLRIPRATPQPSKETP